MKQVSVGKLKSEMRVLFSTNDTTVLQCSGGETEITQHKLNFAPELLLFFRSVFDLALYHQSYWDNNVRLQLRITFRLTIFAFFIYFLTAYYPFRKGSRFRFGLIVTNRKALFCKNSRNESRLICSLLVDYSSKWGDEWSKKQNCASENLLRAKVATETSL